MAGWDADLQLALELADAADALTMQRFRAADLVVEAKPDLTPVSDADRGCEELVRARVAAQRPGDALLGEELGATESAPRRWVIDPIDGTKNYVRGVPVWATLIALQQDEQTVVGVVSAPALGRRWWAARGSGAFADGTPCRVSQVAHVGDAFLSYSSLEGWEAIGRRDRFRGLVDTVWRSRAFGDFWSYMLVAEGAVDIACEPEVSLWDLAALSLIVEEAGGRFTDLAGADRVDGGSAVATNGVLHEQVLAALRP
ncbi:MAG TPA: histidinol-phosphatase [Mycobacteriales bacterium]|nr:histidinol-phosphatase [Mycobacteriales bacterium]